MQNLLLKFRQSSIICEKPGCFVSYLPKGLPKFCIFCLDLKLLINLVSVSMWKPGLFLILANNSRSKEKKKLPKVSISKYETSAKFEQKLLNTMVVGDRQSVEFFRQNTWFLINNRALSIFL